MSAADATLRVQSCTIRRDKYILGVEGHDNNPMDLCSVLRDFLGLDCKVLSLGEYSNGTGVFKVVGKCSSGR
jgi:hypothetical protein